MKYAIALTYLLMCGQAAAESTAEAYARGYREGYTAGSNAPPPRNGGGGTNSTGIGFDINSWGFGGGGIQGGGGEQIEGLNEFLQRGGNVDYFALKLRRGDHTLTSGSVLAPIVGEIDPLAMTGADLFQSFQFDPAQPRGSGVEIMILDADQITGSDTTPVMGWTTGAEGADTLSPIQIDPGVFHQMMDRIQVDSGAALKLFPSTTIAPQQ